MMIRRATSGDARAICGIARAVLEDPWSERAIEEEIGRTSGLVLAAAEGERVVGFAIAWFVADEASVLLIAVADDAQRRRIGTRLLGAIEASARSRGARTVHLEVRASNASARAFYRARGYREVGVRARYYGGAEDAIAMKRDLPSLDLDVAILAGGRGARMGGALKPLLVRGDGATILEATARALEASAGRILLVAPVELLAVLDPGHRFVQIADPRVGPARALACAAEASRAEWLLAVGGDQPNLDASLPGRLSCEVRDDVDAVVFEVRGARQPLGAFYRRSAILELPSRPSSLQEILDRLRTSQIADDAFASLLDDADTPEDAERLGLAVPSH
jgi:ribosomal-protein-alanine acetyltransferase